MTAQVNGHHLEQDLLSKLPALKVEPLWTVMSSMAKARPSPKAEVCQWRYDELRPVLLEAGRAVSAEEAERRVLMLVNPALGAPYTTDTVYAGLQLILPGETAPAHRHQAFALRFIIEGSRGFTAVSGEKISMARGDVILTPQWQWHDHGHDGGEPMIWLDGLDLPLYHKMPTHFAEPYHEPRYPSKPAADSPLRFPWAEMKARLDKQTGVAALEHYHGASGGHISVTLGCHAERVDANQSSKTRRDTCSYVFHVESGSGETHLELHKGTSQVVTWAKSDTFAVPAWSRITHQAYGPETAYLFALNDLPLLEGLSMFVTDK